ncbi:SDR family oxidoreductase [Sphingomonas sp. 22176]|uniref:SDR family oxidoreductase n=1 Tax=Sphingomonas sp. 22176 TaxID=3453884 RepID=UPI003F8491E8
MKIVILGGSGLVGCQLVAKLAGLGHDAVAASSSNGVDSMTGAGLLAAFTGAQVVVDVTNPKSFEDDTVIDFFRSSAGNIAAAARKAGVSHLLVLSIVGTDRLQNSGYFRGKLAQEQAFVDSGVPFTIVRATQFFEFLRTIADGHTQDGVAYLPTFVFQPMASADVALALANAVTSQPVNGIIEIAGPDRAPLSEFVGTWLGAQDDPRGIVPDEGAGYFGAPADDTTLVPGDDARLMPTRFEVWLEAQPAKAAA